MAVKPGWTGRVFEDFSAGDIYEHPLGRTVTQADNIWFTCLTMNTNPIHFDAEYARETEFKRPLVNSCFTLALVTGQSVIDLTMNGVANLGWEDVKLPNPLFEGDTVYAKSEVLETRESKSRPKVGIVRVKDYRCESGWDTDHRIPPHLHGLEARACPEAPWLSRNPNRSR
jgi:acyl dehydratase